MRGQDKSGNRSCPHSNRWWLVEPSSGSIRSIRTKSRRNRALGATGATSNPIIVSDLIETGRFNQELAVLLRDGLDDSAIAWRLTDTLVSLRTNGV